MYEFVVESVERLMGVYMREHEDELLSSVSQCPLLDAFLVDMMYVSMKEIEYIKEPKVGVALDQHQENIVILLLFVVEYNRRMNRHPFTRSEIERVLDFLVGALKSYYNNALEYAMESFGSSPM